MNWPWVLVMPPSPLQEPVLELFWIPAKFSLHQQIHCTCVMPVVLKHELLPGQREEIAETVGDVLLPGVRWEGRSMHYVVADIDVLDRNVGEGYAKSQCASPPVRGEVC